MKNFAFIFILFLTPAFVFAQEETDEKKPTFKTSDNYLTYSIDGEEFEAHPRKVKFGRVVYYTGNIAKPETMLRVWLGTFDKKESEKSGTYLIVDMDNSPNKKEIQERKLTEKYAGVAFVRYVKETKSPRMRYHVGDSQNNDEILIVENDGEGTMTITFDSDLAGTHWKERDINTIFGGVGRLRRKVESKVVSQATGYDWNIDPEGNGYRTIKEDDDTIRLSDVKMVIKLKE